MISSAIPSVKYSFSGSALMLTNGSTATDLPGLLVTVVAVGVDGVNWGGVAPV